MSKGILDSTPPISENSTYFPLGFFRPKRKWTFENCAMDAKKFKTKGEWIKYSANAYHAAHRNGWLEKCCTHMPSNIFLQEWDLVSCKDDAKRFAKRSEWAKASKQAYFIARTYGWMNDCCKHMEK